MVIPLVSLGLGDLKAPILARRGRVTTEQATLHQNILSLKTRPSRLHSSAVQHGGATLRLSSTRGAPMMTISSRAAATALASLLLMSPVFAQTTAPTTPAPAAKAAPMAPAEKKAAKPRTAASLECSKEADTKGVHGKERKKFMSECKKAAADKAK